MSEIEQTEEFLSKALWPDLRSVLSKHLETLNKAAAHVEKVQVDKETAINPVAVHEPVAHIIPERVTTVRAFSGGFVPIEDFAWDQGSYNTPTISIFVELEGVGSVKQNVFTFLFSFLLVDMLYTLFFHLGHYFHSFVRF